MKMSQEEAQLFDDIVLNLITCVGKSSIGAEEAQVAVEVIRARRAFESEGDTAETRQSKTGN